MCNAQVRRNLRKLPKAITGSTMTQDTRDKEQVMMKEQNFPNRVVTAMLRSPFHGWVPGTMLMTVVGRQSGDAMTLPVNYIQQRDCITVISRRNRIWWRNLRGGRAVTLRLNGKDVKGTGTVVEDERGVAAWLTGYLQEKPKRA